MFIDKNEARPEGVDLKRIEVAVREILEAVGEDPDRDGLLETPARVARMYAEMFAGLRLRRRSIWPRCSMNSTTKLCSSET